MRRAGALALCAVAPYAAALGAAACAPREGGRGAPALGDALRALRHETVGDRRLEPGAVASPRSARSARVAATSEATRALLRSYVTDRVAIVPPSDSSTAMLESGGDPEVPTRVIPFTTTAAAPVTLWVGDTVALPTPQAPDGTPPSMVRDLRWSSTEPQIAVAELGVVTARAAGTAEIIAWRRVGQTVTPITVLPAVRGVVSAADGGALRARVIVRGRAAVDTTLTTADGAFVFRLARVADERRTVRVEPLDDAYAPAELVDAPLERLAALDVLLLPRQWRIATGTYAGAIVPIAPAIAQRRARDGRRVWHVARDDAAGSTSGAAVGWNAAQLPLAVAFEHERGVAPSVADSVAFWSIARQLERDWGRPLFRPATLPPHSSDDAPSFDGVVVTIDPRIRTAGLTTIGWDGDGDVGGATVAVQSRALLATPAVITHELLHALGVGHAGDGWASVMHPVAGDGAGGRASADDVAYAQLLYAMRRHAERHAERRVRAPRGVTPTPVGIAEAAAAR